MFRRRVISPTGTYSDVHLPPVDGGYRDLQWNVTPRTDPTPDGFFWSHQFGFVDGDQGYCGLQTYNADFGGKIAIFSIWSALAADGPEFAGPFGGEGTGYSVRVAYDWRVDATYRLMVSPVRDGHDGLDEHGGLDEHAAAGTWWQAHVTDVDTGRSTSIGRIAVPSSWRGLASSSVMWSERYAGPMVRCADIRHSVVDLTDVAANAATVVPTGYSHHLADPPTCPNSSITPLPNGARHEMGVGSEPTWP